jgi:hypothetical protein
MDHVEGVVDVQDDRLWLIGVTGRQASTMADVAPPVFRIRLASTTKSYSRTISYATSARPISGAA